MSKQILFSIFFGLALAYVQGSMAMSTESSVEISQDLLYIHEEVLRQRETLEAFVFSKREQLLETSRYIPENVAKGLDQFFSDPQVRILFVDRYKYPMIAGTVQSHMQRDGGMRSKLLQENESYYIQQHKKIEIDTQEANLLLRQLLTKYRLVDICKTGHNFVFISPFWNGYVVKIAYYRCIYNDAMIAFPYQLIRNILYNQNKHVHCLIKSLYHIPSTPDDINDDNYVVVEPLQVNPL